jgi:hypothetical protein
MIPLKVLKGPLDAIGPQLCSLGFVLPHIWCSWLYLHHREEFFLSFIGAMESEATARLTSFWDNMHPADPRKTSPRFSNFGILRRFGIPLGLHGDAAPCTKRDSVNTVMMYGLLGSGITMDTMLIIFAYFMKTSWNFEDLEANPEWRSGTTECAIWKLIVWSLLAL